LILPLVRIDPDDDNDFDLNGTMIGRMRLDAERAQRALRLFRERLGSKLKPVDKALSFLGDEEPAWPTRVGDIQTARRLADTVSA
jgi:hypothetical protein